MNGHLKRVLILLLIFTFVFQMAGVTSLSRVQAYADTETEETLDVTESNEAEEVTTEEIGTEVPEETEIEGEEPSDSAAEESGDTETVPEEMAETPEETAEIPEETAEVPEETITDETVTVEEPVEENEEPVADTDGIGKKAAKADDSEAALKAAAEDGAKATKTGTVLAFTSDVHNKSGNVAANRMSNWIENVEKKYGEIDVFAFGGDMADASASGTTFFDLAQNDMDVVDDNGIIGVYTTGNHEYNSNRTYGVVNNETTAQYKVNAEGYNNENCRIYCLGSVSGSSSYSTQISSLTQYLSGAGNDRPIFIITHFPLHYYNSRTTDNASDIIEVLNNAVENNNQKIVFLWGHNHTMSDTYYDYIYRPGDSIPTSSSSSSAKTIKFYYGAAGCMSDSEYGTGSASVKGKALVVTINDDKELSFSYFNENGVNVTEGGTFSEVVATGLTIDDITEADDSGQTIVVENPTIATGKTLQLNVTFEPFGATGAVGWSSSDESIATVDENGKVKGISEGKATITATLTGSSKKGGTTASIEVNVGPRGAEPTYVLTSTLEPGKNYIITNGNSGTVHALTNNSGSVASTDVEVDGDTITTDNTDIVFTAEGSGTSITDFVNDGYYLAVSRSGSGYSYTYSVSLETSARNIAWTYNNNYLSSYRNTSSTSNIYVYYSSNNSNFSATNSTTSSSGSSRAVYLFVEQEGSGGGDDPTPVTTTRYEETNQFTVGGEYILAAQRTEPNDVYAIKKASDNTITYESLTVVPASGNEKAYIANADSGSIWTYSTDGLLNGGRYLYPTSSQNPRIQTSTSTRALSFSDGKLSFTSSGGTVYYITRSDTSFSTSTNESDAATFRLFEKTEVPAEQVDATGISLNKEALELAAGETETLTATLVPENATTAVSWSSSNESVATVSKGVVTAVGAGTATITASAGEDVTATCLVTVTEPDAVRYVEVHELKESKNYIIAVTKDDNTVYVINNSNGSLATAELAITLASGDSAAYIETGNTSVVWKYNGGDRHFMTQGSYYLNITNSGTARNLTINNTQAYGVGYAGDHLYLQNYSATSGNKYYVAFNNSTFSATASNASASAARIMLFEEYTAPASVTGVTLDKDSMEVNIGGTKKLTATVEPDNAGNKNVSWESSAPSIATVDNSGNVTGVAEGTATITVTTEEGGKTATCEVTVTKQKTYVIIINDHAMSTSISNDQYINNTSYHYHGLVGVAYDSDTVIDDSIRWVITETNGGYYIQSLDGKYLNAYYTATTNPTGCNADLRLETIDDNATPDVWILDDGIDLDDWKVEGSHLKSTNASGTASSAKYLSEETGTNNGTSLFSVRSYDNSDTSTIEEISDFTLSYNSNAEDATGITSDQTGLAKYTVSANGFMREGYVFQNWNTKADGTGTDYDPGEIITLTEDTTLYAQWKEICSTHTYGGPVWNWTGDDQNGYTSATATFTCSVCGTVVTLTDDDIDVQTAEGDCQTPTGATTYTAIVNLEGVDFTGVKSVGGDATAKVTNTEANGEYVMAYYDGSKYYVIQQTGTATPTVTTLTELTSSTVTNNMLFVATAEGSFKLTNKGTGRYIYSQSGKLTSNTTAPSYYFSLNDEGSLVYTGRNSAYYYSIDSNGEFQGPTTDPGSGNINLYTIGTAQYGPHNYGFQNFTWNGNTATANYKCSICEDLETVNATVTKTSTTPATCEDPAYDTYTATVSEESSLDGQAYSDTKTIVAIEEGEAGYIPADAAASEDYVLAYYDGSVYHVLQYSNSALNMVDLSSLTADTVDNTMLWTSSGSSAFSLKNKGTSSIYLHYNDSGDIMAAGTATSARANFNFVDGKLYYLSTSSYSTYQNKKLYYYYSDGQALISNDVDPGTGYIALYAYSEGTSIPSTALGHDWDYEHITWNWNGYDCQTATLTCIRDNTHTLDVSATVTGPVDNVYTATITGPDGKTYTDTREAAHTHTYGEPEYTWAADNSTCTATAVCNGCEEGTEGHSVTETVTAAYEVTTPATCTAAGSGTYTATFENELFITKTKVVEIPAAGHNMTHHAAVAPTCTTVGTVEYWSCSVCSKNFSDEAGTTEITTIEVPATDHTPLEAIRENEVAATCTTAGSYDEVVYCSVCNAEISRTSNTVTALGHNWGDWSVTTAPTCTEAGVETRECSRCDATETREVAALGHDIEHHEAKAPTCTVAGWEAYDTCTRCDYTTYAEIPATGHSYGEPVWTWAEDYSSASANFTCSNCGDVQNVTDTDIESTQGTGNHVGYTEYTASVSFGDKTYSDIQYKINQYTLTFKDGDEVIATITKDYGTEFNAPDNPTKAFYIFSGWDTEVPETMPSENKTFNATWTAKDTFYLVGSMNDWTVSEAYEFVANPQNPDEYSVSAALAAGNEIKVVRAVAGVAKNEDHYPSTEHQGYNGWTGNYVVDEYHAGDVTVYFRPAGNFGDQLWQNFGGYFYIEGDHLITVEVSPADKGEAYVTRDGSTAAATTAPNGMPLTVHYTPADNYQLDKIEVLKEDGTAANVTMNGDVFSMPNYNIKVKVSFKVITWTFDEFEWTGNNETGYTAAVAKYNGDNGSTKTVEAAVTSQETPATCETPGRTVYTASVAADASLDGTAKEDTKTVSIPALGHAYGEPAWTWDGFTKATATFTCANDPTHKQTVVAEGDDIASSTSGGTTTYTATITGPDGKTYTNTTSDNSKLITEVTATFEPPIAGDDARITHPASVPEGSPYRASVVRYFAADKTTQFEGTFAEGETYYAELWISVETDGYGFKGGVDSIDGQSVPADPVSITVNGENVTGNIPGAYVHTLVRVLAPFTVTNPEFELTLVVYKNTGADGTAELSKTTAHRGETITVTATPAPGSRFTYAEYKEAGSIVNATRIGEDGTFTMPPYDTEVTVYFVREEYDVTVTTNNEAYGTAKTKVYQSWYNMGDQVELEATSNTGYEFKEWNVISGGVTIGADNKFTVGTSDVEVQAVFAPIKYTINYELNGGTNAEANPAEYTIESNDITLQDPSWTGHTFGGWYDNAEFTGEPVTTIAKGSTGNVTIYAKWTTNAYTVTWKNFDGTVLETDQTVPYGTIPEYDDVTPTKEATKDYRYEFAGWDPEIAAVTGDATYTAKFNEIARTYSNEPVWSWTGSDADGYTSATATFTTNDSAAVFSISVSDEELEKVTTPATCTEGGQTVYKASVEFKGDEYEENKTVSIPAKGHTLAAHAAVAATCETAGNSAYWSCSECGKYFSDAEGNTEIAENSWNIPAKGHDWKLTTDVWNTDHTSAVLTFVCNTDDSHTETVPVSGDAITSVITTEPTATTPGVRTYTATVTLDGKTYTVTDSEAIPATGSTVSGNITSYVGRTEEGQVTVQLFKGNSEEAAYEATVTADNKNYTFEGVVAGTYTMKVSKKDHVTRSYEITADGTAITQDVKIHLKGDVNGDGKLTTADVSRVNSHVKKVDPITDEYIIKCGDVVGNDGKLTTADVSRINSHVKKVDFIW